MLLILDGRQTIYPEIENLMDECRAGGWKIALVAPQANESMLKSRALEYQADYSQCLSNLNIETVCRAYQELMDDASAAPFETMIVSNLGHDLAAAILLGCEFAWAMDVTR